MAERKLGAAIHGAGWVAGEHLKAYARNPHCEVVAISSRRESSCRRVALEAGLDPDKLAIYTSFDDLLADPRVDVLSICTPNHLHVEEGIKAAKAGKHFIIEKPIAIDLEGLRALRDAGYQAVTRETLLIRLEDKPGALAAVSARLRDAGLDLRAMHIIRHDGPTSIVSIVSNDQQRAAEVLSDILIQRGG